MTIDIPVWLVWLLWIALGVAGVAVVVIVVMWAWFGYVIAQSIARGLRW